MEVKRAKNVKKTPINRFWPFLAKLLVTRWLEFGTGSFLTRIYNFVFKKIFVGGRLDNNWKMLTNITITTPPPPTTTTAVLDLLGYAAGIKGAQNMKGILSRNCGVGCSIF